MKVLFIGNSHTYFNDMPHLFAAMCESLTGERTDVTMLAFSNKTLDWHCEEYFSVRFALLYGGYDFCVIQQFGHPIPPIEETEPPLRKLIELCSHVGTKPVLYMTWAKKNEPENAELISRIYRTLAEKYRTPLAPIAEIYDSLRVDHPEIELYWSDGSHASPYGDYLIAASAYGVITGKTDLDLPPIGLDFMKDRDLGKPRKLIEDPAECAVTLDKEKTAVILAAVSEELKKLK